MRKKTIIFAAALCIALSACGGQTAQESAPSATAVPTAVQTVQPTAAPTPVVTAEPVLAPTEVPVDTPVPTPPKASPPPSVEPVATATPEPVTTPTPEPAPTQPPEPSSEPTPEPEPTETPTRPDDEIVLQAYHEAAEAYSWFDMTTLPVESDNGVIGPGYYPVSDERFPTLEALRGYLKSLFSDEIVDRLLPIDGEHYRDVDGRLCAIDTMRGSDENTGEIIETVIWPEDGSDSLCAVHVEVELIWEDENYPEGKRTYDFPYQKVGDKWVFTYFKPIM